MLKNITLYNILRKSTSIFLFFSFFNNLLCKTKPNLKVEIVNFLFHISCLSQCHISVIIIYTLARVVHGTTYINLGKMHKVTALVSMIRVHEFPQNKIIIYFHIKCTDCDYVTTTHFLQILKIFNEPNRVNLFTAHHIFYNILLC